MSLERIRGTIIPALVAALWCGVSGAEEAGPKVIPKSAEGVEEGKPPGWHPLLRLTGNFALGQSKNIPGTPDGVSLQLGYIIFGGLDYLSRQKTQEWTNGLGMELAYTRTPVVDALIKSVDKIDFRSTYLYHPPKIPWLGPFVAFRLSSPMLPGYVVRADPSNVVYLEPEETQELNDAGEPVDETGAVIDAAHPSVTQFASAEKIELTDAFAPLILRESVGIFAIPLDKPWLKTDFRLGFGAWETFVRDGFVVEDNADTDLFELRRMQDSVQLGPELGIMLKGAAKEILTYGASALFMQPVYHNADTDLEGIELLNMEFEAALGVKIVKFLSIDYSFKAYKQPLIVDEWQIQNNLLVSISFEVPAPAPPPPVCPPPPECPECKPCPECESCPVIEKPAEAAEKPVEPAPETAETPATEGEPPAETTEEPGAE